MKRYSYLPTGAHMFVLLLFMVCFAFTSISGFAFSIANLRKEAEELMKKERVGSWPSTVSKLNVTEYLGLWYQVYGDKFNNGTFQPASFCATATYGLDRTHAGRITVLNQEHYGSVNGPAKNISGYAWQPDPSEAPGKLKVVLHGGAPFPAPYWVLKLGPVLGGKYEWAIVSDEFRLTLFVLARNVDRFYAKYNATVYEELVGKLGFSSSLNKPMTIVQQGCTYP